MQCDGQHGIALNYILPRNPPQNACVECFDRTVRYAWLLQYYWDDLEHIQQFATEWR